MKRPAVPRAELAQHHAGRGEARGRRPPRLALRQSSARSGAAAFRPAPRRRQTRGLARIPVAERGRSRRGQRRPGSPPPAPAEPPASAGEALTVPCLRSPLPGQGSRLSPAPAGGSPARGRRTELSRVPGPGGSRAPERGSGCSPPPRPPSPAGRSPGPPAAGCPPPPSASPSALRSSSKFSLLLIFQVPAKLGMAGRALRTAAAGTRRCCSLSGSGTL